MRRPWYRTRTNSWVVQIGGKQVSLWVDPRYRGNPPKAPPREPPPEVVQRFHEVMRQKAEPEDRTFEQCATKYLDHLDSSPENRKSARLHLKWFGEFVPETCTQRIDKMRVARLRRHFLTEYLATRPHWKPNTRRYAITRILAALNHCEKEQYIPANPLRGYPRPRVERRKAILTDEEFDTLVAAAGADFRALLVCMRELGTRPGELLGATIEHCDLERGVMMVRNKIRALTDEPLRPVFLTDRARETIRARVGGRDSGPIFLNSAGSPWTRHTSQQYMRRLRTRLGLGEGCTLYAVRHRWASHAINEGDVNPAMVAIQAGWTDLRRLMRTYLHEDTDAMRRAMEKAAKRD